MAALHKFNPVRLGLYPRPGGGALCPRPQEARLPQGPAHARYRLRRRHSVGAAGAAGRADGRRRSVARRISPSRSAHAQESGVAVDYRATTAEDLAAAGERFDVVLAMEVVEHVTDVAAFVQTCASMVKPGGLMIAATFNRTLKSFALAIVGAEYVLRWLPRGTHQWDKFVTPNELETRVRARRPAGDRRARRDLQSVRRPLAIVVRHGRELHAGGGRDLRKKENRHDPRTGRIQFAEGLEPPTGGRRGAQRHPEMARQQGIAAQAFPARARRQDRRRRLYLAVGRGGAEGA